MKENRQSEGSEASSPSSLMITPSYLVYLIPTTLLEHGALHDRHKEEANGEFNKETTQPGLENVRVVLQAGGAWCAQYK